MRNYIVLTAIGIVLLMFSAILTFSFVIQKQPKLQVPERMMKVKIISIQQPRIEGGTQFYSGCVYETETKERFFSSAILGGDGEVFIVQPVTVNYKHYEPLTERQ